MSAAADTLRVPSYQRVEAGSVNVPIAQFPSPTDAAPTDSTQAAAEWVSQFNDKLRSLDVSALSNLFLPDCCYWRDHLALSWELRSLTGREAIASFVNANLDTTTHGKPRLGAIQLDTSSTFRSPCVTDIGVKCVQAFLTITTDVGSGRGLVRLVPHDGTFKAFTLFTSLEEINDHGESVLGRRPNGVEHGSVNDRKNWLDRRVAESNFEQADPTVLVIGKGRRAIALLIK